MPNGTYVDMCSRLPLVDPEKIAVPNIILRGEYDGIAGFDDLMRFIDKLPNADNQSTVLAVISHARCQQTNYLQINHLLSSFFAHPAPRYRDPGYLLFFAIHDRA